MKRLCNGFIMSLSMFSIIPCPQVWNDNAMNLIIPWLPAVGGIIGGIWYGLFLLLDMGGVPLLLFSALLMLCPLFVSGFIHIDGYMDTSDAIFSRAELVKKRAILKDSHVGAFAVIALGVYLLLGVSAVCGFLEKGADGMYLLFIPILSRCVSGYFLLTTRPISENGFAAAFKKDTKPIHSALLVTAGTVCIVTAYAVLGIHALVILGAVLLGGVLSALYVIRQLDGISGDLCGFVSSVSELCGLIALAIV